MASGSSQKPEKDTETSVTSIAFSTKPTPPRAGANEFEVMLKDPSGKPVADADVALSFYMPPMPSMKMPEMRNTVKLSSVGNGIYRGKGSIGMAGEWDVTITATREGKQLALKKLKLAAK